MEITDLPHLLQNFTPVFTAPTYQTFVVIVTGWIISQRHGYVTEVIFSSGHVGDGHWSRSIASSATPPGTSTPSPCAWPSWSSRFSPRHHLLLGRRRHPLSQTRTDPLRRRHALRPAHLQSREIPGQLGTRLGRADPDRRLPLWARSKVFALPIAMRLYRNRQGLTKGKKNPKGKKGQQKPTKPKHDPNHRTRPELALELIIMVAQWFPNDEIMSPVTAPTAVKASSLTCRPTCTSSAMCIPMEHSTSGGSKKEKRKGRAARKGTGCPA